MEPICILPPTAAAVITSRPLVQVRVLTLTSRFSRLRLLRGRRVSCLRHQRQRLGLGGDALPASGGCRGPGGPAGAGEIQLHVLDPRRQGPVLQLLPRAGGQERRYALQLLAIISVIVLGCFSLL